MLTVSVALRKESVDRNTDGEKAEYDKIVALRKESVDRNLKVPVNHTRLRLSLSARRAWIEITLLQQQELLSLTSLSARRAWNVSLSDCSGGGVHADIRFNFKNCYSKKLSHKII